MVVLKKLNFLLEFELGCDFPAYHADLCSLGHLCVQCLIKTCNSLSGDLLSEDGNFFTVAYYKLRSKSEALSAHDKFKSLCFFCC